jgi:hypothetical protein
VHNNDVDLKQHNHTVAGAIVHFAKHTHLLEKKEEKHEDKKEVKHEEKKDDKKVEQKKDEKKADEKKPSGTVENKVKESLAKVSDKKEQK